VLGRGDLLVNGDGDSQLLHHLSGQAGLEALSGLSFAAREFPEAAQMGARRAAGNQDLPTPDDEGRRHFDHRSTVAH
jgi:hypothetical protein